MNKDAKRLCCFVTVTELVASDVARLFEVVGLVLNVVRCFDVGLLHVCDLNVTLDIDALILRFWYVLCIEMCRSLGLSGGEELPGMSDARLDVVRSMAVLVCVAREYDAWSKEKLSQKQWTNRFANQFAIGDKSQVERA
jgi:hypothetical protein